MSDDAKRALAKVLRKPENAFCADCKAKGPTWCSKNIGCFVCLNCAGQHRALGTHISQVRSVSLDTWTMQAVQFMDAWGNKRVNACYEARLSRDKPIGPSVTDARRNAFIQEKYEQKAFYSPVDASGASAPGASGDASQSQSQSSPDKRRELRRLQRVQARTEGAAPNTNMSTAPAAATTTTATPTTATTLTSPTTATTAVPVQSAPKPDKNASLFMFEGMSVTAAKPAQTTQTPAQAQTLAKHTPAPVEKPLTEEEQRKLAVEKRRQARLDMMKTRANASPWVSVSETTAAAAHTQTHAPTAHAHTHAHAPADILSASVLEDKPLTAAHLTPSASAPSGLSIAGVGGSGGGDMFAGLSMARSTSEQSATTTATSGGAFDFMDGPSDTPAPTHAAAVSVSPTKPAAAPAKQAGVLSGLGLSGFDFLSDPAAMMMPRQTAIPHPYAQPPLHAVAPHAHPHAHPHAYAQQQQQQPHAAHAHAQTYVAPVAVAAPAAASGFDFMSGADSAPPLQQSNGFDFIDSSPAPAAGTTSLNGFGHSHSSYAHTTAPAASINNSGDLFADLMTESDSGDAAPSLDAVHTGAPAHPGGAVPRTAVPVEAADPTMCTVAGCKAKRVSRGLCVHHMKNPNAPPWVLAPTAPTVTVSSPSPVSAVSVSASASVSVSPPSATSVSISSSPSVGSYSAAPAAAALAPSYVPAAYAPAHAYAPAPISASVAASPMPVPVAVSPASATASFSSSFSQSTSPPAQSLSHSQAFGQAQSQAVDFNAFSASLSVSSPPTPATPSYSYSSPPSAPTQQTQTPPPAAAFSPTHAIAAALPELIPTPATAPQAASSVAAPVSQDALFGADPLFGDLDVRTQPPSGSGFDFM